MSRLPSKTPLQGLLQGHTHQAMSKSPDTYLKYLSTWDVNMSTLPQLSKPTRPNQVHSTFSQSSYCGPLSTLSGSSVTSSSQQSSPIMSPDTAIHTTNSSIQASPELMPILDEDVCSPNFQLPDSIVSRKASSNSIGQTLLNHSQAIPETTGSGSTAAAAPTNPKSNLIRRLSSRASRRITTRRSSVAPASRDTSLGPCLLRRRSDSNATAPPDFPAVAVESESDFEEIDDLHSLISLSGFDSAVRGSSANSTTGSLNGLSNTMAAPVIPTELLHGAWVTKVSKKNRGKKVCLVYDPDSSRLLWDKTKPNKFVHMDEILAVRSGTDVQQYGIDLNLRDPTTLFTIIYAVPKKTDNNNTNKMMHVVADDLETCHAWVGFLDAMLRHRQEVMESLMSFDEGAIAHYWHSEMARQYGEQPRSKGQEELDITAVKRLCQNLHIYNAASVIEKNFQLADVRERARLNFAEFLDFVRKTNQRPDIRRVIHEIAHEPRRGITLEEFLYFLRVIQKEDVDSNLPTWEKKFTRLARSKPLSDAYNEAVTDSSDVLRMGEAAFVSFIASKQNGPLKEEPQSYTLDHPLSDYFISSSHNTYLLGRQVKGQSSIEGYITALTQGCRCVEVDAWDGPDGPQVVHGRTLTTAISFREVIAAIHKYAFVKTLQMLTISIENHCSPPQQQMMYDIMKEIFGSTLIEEPLDMASKDLPSPTQVRERIAIKVKVPVPEQQEPAALVGRRRGNSVNSPRTQAPIPEGGVAETPQTVPQSPMLTPSQSSRRLASKARVNTITEGAIPDLASSDNESGSDTAGNGRSSNKTVPVLGKLGVYFAGVKFSGFDSPDAKKFNHIFSFMESSFSKHSRTREAKTALDLHNMRHMMRVYPDGIRLSSSNFDPLIYWRRGVQMAALNWQTNDLGMQINRAMFEGGTDSSGYVLKPEALRRIQVGPLDDNIVKGQRKYSRVSFSIDVLSAQQLMRPANLAPSRTMNPYVEIEVFDGRAFEPKAANPVRAADSALKVQTEPIRDNGFNPMFNNGRFNFSLTTKYPEFVFVKFTVKLSPNGESYNHKDQHGVASWMVKLSNLKDGYRTIPLENHEGVQYLFSTLFCKIKRHPNDDEVYIAGPPRPQEGNKLKSLGEKVFGRINTSPRTTLDKSSFEKSSYEKSSFEQLSS